jgi:hypothetical protein
MREESETSKLYANLVADLRGDRSIGAVISPQQITSVEEVIKKLRWHYTTLQDELQGWRNTKRLATMSIDCFQRSTERLETQIASAKVILSPISVIPEEVWIKVFGYCLDQEMRDYIKKPGHLPLRSLPLVLSSVCQRWRNIIHWDLGIWNVVNIPLNRYLFFRSKEFLQDMLRRGQNSFTFFTNLSLSPVSHETDSPGGDGILPQNVTYTTYLFINDFSSSTWAKASHHPFRNATTIKLNFYSDEAPNSIDVDVFPMVQCLDLECSGNGLIHIRNLAELRSLEVLNLRLREMPNPPLSHFIKSNLEELRIRYSGENKFTREARRKLTPNLRLLGVTYPFNTLIESISVPNLEEIEIYGPDEELVSFEEELAIIDIFKKVQRIKIIDWNRAYTFIGKGGRVLDGSMNVGSMFVKLAGKMNNLKSVLFSSCNITGSELVTLFRERSEDTTKTLPQFERLTFSDCKGITRAECEELQTLVPRLSVYV